jgi:hypothetical protein
MELTSSLSVPLHPAIARAQLEKKRRQVISRLLSVRDPLFWRICDASFFFPAPEGKRRVPRPNETKLIDVCRSTRDCRRH